MFFPASSGEVGSKKAEPFWTIHARQRFNGYDRARAVFGRGRSSGASEVMELIAAGLGVSSLLREGEAKGVLLEEAERLGADCIFVDAAGMSAADRLLLGGVSGAVTARTRFT